MKVALDFVEHISGSTSQNDGTLEGLKCSMHFNERFFSSVHWQVALTKLRKEQALGSWQEQLILKVILFSWQEATQRKSKASGCSCQL